MRLCVNVSILFREYSFLDRFEHAARTGFDTVEFWWPNGEDLGAVEAAIQSAGLGVALINFDAGSLPAGDRGLLADPRRHHVFRDNVPVALAFGERVGCRRFNALVGVALDGVPRAEQIELARQNVGWAADRAAEVGATVTIEAINTFENGPYLLPTTRAAADFIWQVGRGNVKLQYDVYHMQRMEGNLVATLRQRIEEIAHIQIADSPGRGAPGTGEINYRYVLGEIDRLGYDGFIGLEYLATTPNTVESFGWLPAERSGRVPVDALKLPGRETTL